MIQEARNRRLIVQYLLGELSEQEKIRLEQQYFDDDDSFEQLLIVEGELIDKYVRGEFSGHERERFETHFLASPPRRQRVEIARAWVEYATESSAAVLPVEERRESARWRQSLRHMLGGQNRTLTLAFAAVGLLILIGGSLFIAETVRLKKQVDRIEANRAEALRREHELQQQLAEQGALNQQLADELQRERGRRELFEQELAKPERSVLGAVTLILTPDLVRGAGETKKLIIPPRVDLVRLRLQLDRDEHKSYRAVIETVEGNRIWSSRSLIARTSKSLKIVSLELPAGLFARRGYILTLSGVNADGRLENVAEYYFDVVKE